MNEAPSGLKAVILSHCKWRIADSSASCSRPTHLTLCVSGTGQGDAHGRWEVGLSYGGYFFLIACVGL